MDVLSESTPEDRRSLYDVLSKKVPEDSKKHAKTPEEQEDEKRKVFHWIEKAHDKANGFVLMDNTEYFNKRREEFANYRKELIRNKLAKLDTKKTGVKQTKWIGSSINKVHPSTSFQPISSQSKVGSSKIYPNE